MAARDFSISCVALMQGDPLLVLADVPSRGLWVHGIVFVVNGFWLSE